MRDGFSDGLKNWLSKNWEKIKSERNLITLIVIMGCFFYLQVGDILAQTHQNSYFPEKAENEKLVTMNNEIFFASVEEKRSCKESNGEKKIVFLKKDQVLEDQLHSMLNDHPIKEMVPYISTYDRDIAGMIVGIAKIESNWGKRSPKLNGGDCYNYWGYTGSGSRGRSLGFGCFSSPQEGVDVIAQRIIALANQQLDTPSKMVVWKCGKSCVGHGQESVDRWIGSVSLYYNKIAKL